MPNYSSYVNSFRYQQKTISSGKLNGGATGRAHIGFLESSNYCFRTTIDFVNSSNIYNRPIIISNAKLFLTKDSIRGIPTIKVYISADNVNQPWQLTPEPIFLGENSGNNNLTINLDNQILANFLKDTQDFKILLTTDESKTSIGGRYNNATLSFDWEYGASTGTISKEDVFLGEEVEISIQPIVETYYHEIQWYIVDALENEHLLKKQELGIANRKIKYIYNSDDIIYQYFPRDKITTLGYAKIITYMDDTKKINLGENKIYFTLKLDNNAKPKISKAFFSPNNPESRNGINISNSIKDLYVQSISKLQFSAECLIASGTEVEKYTLTYSGAGLSGIESIFNKSIIENYLISKNLINSGEIIATLNVTDKRGLISEDYSFSATIQPYGDIRIAELQFQRINKETGKEDFISGNSIKGLAEITFSSIKDSNGIEKNGVTINYNIKQDDKNIAGPVVVSSSKIVIDETNNYIIDTSEAIISISAVDNFGSKITEQKIKIPSASYLMHFKPNSLGIGTVASDTMNSLNIGWQTFFSNKVFFSGENGALSIQEGGTNATNRLGAWENIVAEGGTIVGDLLVGLLNENKNLTINGSLYLCRDNTPEIIFGTKNNSQQGKLRLYNDNVNSKIKYEIQQKGSVNEIFQLPSTSLLDGDGSTFYYDILTTKDYQIKVNNPPSLGNSSSIEINGIVIEYGITNSISVNKNSIVNYTLEFKNSFSEPPFIIATRFHNHSDDNNHYNQANTTVWTRTISQESAVISLADSGGYGGSAIRITYIAIGKKK